MARPGPRPTLTLVMAPMLAACMFVPPLPSDDGGFDAGPLVGGSGGEAGGGGGGGGDGLDGGADAGAGAWLRPFAGDAPFAAVFDHDVPRPGRDTNARQVAFWGESLAAVDGAEGYEFLLPTGTQVRAVEAGTVTQAGPSPAALCPLTNSMVAKTEVVVLTPAGFSVRYGFLSQVDVPVGQAVTPGQRLGASGAAGCTASPKLSLVVTRAHDGGSQVPIDPYGWLPATPDPWVADGGLPSTHLWANNQAPALYREVTSNVGTWLKVERVRWLGVQDALRPNNELVDLVYNAGAPNIPTTVQLATFTLANLAGDVITLPAMGLSANQPRVRLFTGSGTATATTRYLGRSSGLWSNTGDCLRLLGQNEPVAEVPLGRSDCPDPACVTGLRNGRFCCQASCGECAGGGCNGRDGGADGCCGSRILEVGALCSGAVPPCLMPP